MIPVHTKSQGFPCGSAGKESACSVEDLDLVPGLGCPGLENSMGCIVHATQLSDFHFRASLVAQSVKGLPVVQETWVRSLGGEDPLEEGKATHCRIVFWPGEFHGL